MAHDPMNPFGLPSMGASMGASVGNSSQNPLLASMEMMRQAMTGLGQSAQGSTGSLSNPLTPEDLERKINDLKVVENWLKLNLSMLSSSIQGLEVQLATVKTLRSFVAMGEVPGASAADSTSTTSNPSPLEVALGLKPAPTSATPPPEPSAQKPSAEPPADGPTTAAEGAPKDATTNNAAAQAWWNMLENQFHQLAAATTQATNQATAAAQSAMSQQAPGETKSSGSRKTAPRKDATAGTTPSAAKRPAKTAAKKTSSRATARTRTASSRAKKTI